MEKEKKGDKSASWGRGFLEKFWNLDLLECIPVFKGDCNLIITSVGVRRQYKSSTGGGRGRGYGHRPSGTRGKILSNRKGHFGRNHRKDRTGLQRCSQIFRSDRNETVRSIWFLTEISGILGWMEIALLSDCFSLQDGTQNNYSNTKNILPLSKTRLGFVKRRRTESVAVGSGTFHVAVKGGLSRHIATLPHQVSAWRR